MSHYNGNDGYDWLGDAGLLAGLAALAGLAVACLVG
jgi:proteasome assembly chaperone (PAC2) family protein